MNEHETMVVFKTSKKWGLPIAIFPCQPGGLFGCMAYYPYNDEMGSILKATKRYRMTSNPDDISFVTDKLKAKGYNLRVWRRMPSESEMAKWLAVGND